MTTLLWIIGVVVYLIIGGACAAIIDEDDVFSVPWITVWPIIVVVGIGYVGALYVKEQLFDGRR